MKTIELKTFEDLQFEPHPHAITLKGLYASQQNIDPYIEQMFEAVQAVMQFPNGYGISVLCGVQFYSNGRDTYEVGTRYCEEDGCTKWEVVGWKTREEVEEIMIELQKI